jgi:putative alpha-1,2-mannosidase
MVGNNSASVVSDAYMKGLRGSDINKLYEALQHGANNEGPMSAVGRKGVEYYNSLGYVPYDVKINENAARTLEYAYDDFTIYKLAKDLNRPKA